MAGIGTKITIRPFSVRSVTSVAASWLRETAGMPTYVYELDPESKAEGCAHCREHFEAVQRMSDDALAVCPKCGAPVRRCIQAPMVGSQDLSKGPSEKRIKDAASPSSNAKAKATTRRASAKARARCIRKSTSGRSAAVLGCLGSWECGGDARGPTSGCLPEQRRRVQPDRLFWECLRVASQFVSAWKG